MCLVQVHSGGTARVISLCDLHLEYSEYNLLLKEESHIFTFTPLSLHILSMILFSNSVLFCDNVRRKCRSCIQLQMERNHCFVDARRCFCLSTILQLQLQSLMFH